jgi:CarD family transcriptional regulator, regulator of rRNA transcription
MVANNGRTGSPTGYAGRRGHPQQFRVAGDGPVRYYGPTRRPQFLEAKKSMTVMFKVGEKVVYPAHGVGVIEGIQTRVVSGSERKFYMLRILDSDMTIMIPTENVNAVGLRRIIGKDMVAKVYRILRDKKVEIDQQTWNRRYREYTEKIKTGSVLEIAKVLRDLFVLKGDKELSFGERKMLDTARNLLVKELAIAKSYSEEKIMEELRTIFAN